MKRNMILLLVSCIFCTSAWAGLFPFPSGGSGATETITIKVINNSGAEVKGLTLIRQTLNGSGAHSKKITLPNPIGIGATVSKADQFEGTGGLFGSQQYAFAPENSDSSPIDGDNVCQIKNGNLTLTATILASEYVDDDMLSIAWGKECITSPW